MWWIRRCQELRTLTGLEHLQCNDGWQRHWWLEQQSQNNCLNHDSQDSHDYLDASSV